MKKFLSWVIGSLLVLAAFIWLALRPWDYERLLAEHDRPRINDNWMHMTGKVMGDAIEDSSAQFVGGMAAARGLRDESFETKRDIYSPAAWDSGEAYASFHELDIAAIRLIASRLEARNAAIEAVREDAKASSGITSKKRRRARDDDKVVLAAAVALKDRHTNPSAALIAESRRWVAGEGHRGNEELRPQHLARLTDLLGRALDQDPVLRAIMQEHIDRPRPTHPIPRQFDRELNRTKPPQEAEIRRIYVDRFKATPVAPPQAWPKPDAWPVFP